MRYYALSVDLLKEHGLGDEPWRQRKGGMALTHEGEATERMGYAGAAEFEAATGAKAMTLREATEWIRG